MSRAIETLHVCWRGQGPCDSQFPPQSCSATWWVGVKGVISSSLSVTAVASLFFTECTLGPLLGPALVLAHPPSSLPLGCSSFY